MAQKNQNIQKRLKDDLIKIILFYFNLKIKINVQNIQTMYHIKN